MMCRCEFISCNKCTTLVGVGDNRGGDAYGALYIWDISEPSLQVCCEPKKYSKAFLCIFI